MMKLLILGGTRFLGRYLAETALTRGHEVTLFNRGRGDTEVFPELERLQGDRDGDLSTLTGRRWDAVIDTCGFVPRCVDRSAQLLADAAEHYTYISSASVYPDLTQADITEQAAVQTLPPETVEEITRGTAGPLYGPEYGPLKHLCEQAAEAAMPGRVLHLRAGLIVGPHDYSDRFTYWPSRVARGGEVLVPEHEDRKIQVIDVRDMAEWNIRMIEARQTGVFNVCGPQQTMRDLLTACRQVTGSDAQFTYVSEHFLEQQEVGMWVELPLWIKTDDNGPVGMFDLNIDRAVAAGLTFRPLADTVRDTWLWDQTRPADAPCLAGLAPDKEARVLQAWHQRLHV